MWSIICTVAVGALAGWIADMIVKSGRSGLLFYTLFGIAGALVGNLLGNLVGIPTSFLRLSLGSILSAVVGACIISFIARKLRK